MPQFLSKDHLNYLCSSLKAISLEVIVPAEVGGIPLEAPF